MTNARSEVGGILIGRNEGERLVRALGSIAGRFAGVVYVDSGSKDDSVRAAKAAGAEVVELDTSRPFTAARARNAGFERLMHCFPQTRLIQFLDGDCQLADGWIDVAARSFRERGDLAVVCGRVRERFPDRTPYNKFLQLEWDRPLGLTTTCGGIAMVRVDVFSDAGGFDPTLIAGEEAEFCYRVRQRGWSVLRVSGEMAVHDADIRSFGQFWTRCVRSGYGFAEGAWRYGSASEQYNLRQLLSILFWGLCLPVVVLLTAMPTRGLSLVLLLSYARLYRKLMRLQFSRGSSQALSRLYARLILIGKFPQAVGVLRFLAVCLLGRRGRLIEYK